MQAAAGVQMHAKPGDRVRKGDPLLTLHTDTPEKFERAAEALEGKWAIGESADDRPDLIIDRIS